MTTKQKILSTCHLRRLIHTQMAHGKKSWFYSRFAPCYGVTLTRARVGGDRNMRPETLEIR